MTYNRRFLNKSHHQMVWLDIVEISGMNQDSVIFKQPRGSFVFVSADSHGHVEPAPWRDETTRRQRGNSRRPARLNPASVTLEKILSPFKDSRHGKLRN